MESPPKDTIYFFDTIVSSIEDSSGIIQYQAVAVVVKQFRAKVGHRCLVQGIPEYTPVRALQRLLLASCEVIGESRQVVGRFGRHSEVRELEHGMLGVDRDCIPLGLDGDIDML